MNIYEKLLAIETELQTVAKNLDVATSNTKSYKAVSERDIIDAVKPLEAKYKVYSYPMHREVIESNILESESSYNGKTTKRTTLMTRIKTIYRFVNAENPEEYIDTVVFSEGIDTQDKGSGKAMTYADKYALMKAYKISTGDDPDQTASEEVEYTAKQKGYTVNVMSYINPEQGAEIQSLLGPAGMTEEELCKAYKIKALSQLPANKFEATVNRLKEKANG